MTDKPQALTILDKPPAGCMPKCPACPNTDWNRFGTVSKGSEPAWMICLDCHPNVKPPIYLP